MKLKFKNFNIADWLSFYRIAAAPFLLILIFSHQRELFTWFLLVSYLTDAVDGIIARSLKITTSRGSEIDSVGDQITFGTGLIGLWIFERNFIVENYLIILLVLLPYLIQMAIAFSKYGKPTAFHTYLAKLSAVLQSFFILWFLFFGPLHWLFYVMIIIGLLETVEEVILIFMYQNWVDGVKGIYWALADNRRLTNRK